MCLGVIWGLGPPLCGVRGTRNGVWGVWGGHLGPGTLPIGGKESRNGVWGGHLGSLGIWDPHYVG